MNGGRFITPAPTRLPGDLMPKTLRGGPGGGASGMSRDEMIAHLVENSDILVATAVIETGLIGRTVLVTTTPVKVVLAQFMRGYIFLNPTTSTGLTAFGTIFASSTRAALATGDSQATPVGVANYDNMALFLNITGGGGGTVKIDAQTQDPVTLTWATSQSDLFALPSAVGTYYARIGALGVDRSFAAAFTIGAAGSSIFQLDYVLKDGLVGSASGLPNTIYLGGPDVTSTTGYPLLEGHERGWFFRPNSQLYAVSQIAAGVNLSIFELQ